MVRFESVVKIEQAGSHVWSGGGLDIFRTRAAALDLRWPLVFVHSYLLVPQTLRANTCPDNVQNELRTPCPNHVLEKNGT
jgi:hypothetical protein